ncbi:MAG TPA: DUF2071 domain-containing protein [Longimicrobiaceae bacterium]
MVTTLRHFALVTYAFPPERLLPHLHPRFEPETVPGPGGAPRALLSVVPFEDADFRFAALPRPRWRFGQTNYRVYVRDRATGERAVWFFGTSLDSWTVAVPRRLWKLPWHRGRIRFDTDWDAAAGRYARYRMTTESAWAPVEMELEDTGLPVAECAGFAELETALLVLTHPLRGFYHRRDGRLGSYSIWHDRLRPSVARLAHARFDLLDRLGVVPFVEQREPHSVWVQHETEFQIRLPPRAVE